MRVHELKQLGILQELIDVWESRGFRELTDVQEKALLHPSILQRKNLLVLAPTTSGKTFVGEVLAVLTGSQLKRVLYLVPYKAMADEKYYEFTQAYLPLGISVVISSGDHSEFDADIRSGSFSIAIIVTEKLSQLLVQTPGIVADCGLLIVDEIQLIRDKSRGPILEMLLTRIRQFQQQPQIIGLSATMSAVNDLDKWLDADLVLSTSRPVPLWESVCDLSGAVSSFNVSTRERRNYRLEVQSPDTEELLARLVTHFAEQGKQMLVFRSTPDATEKAAEALASRLPMSAVPGSVGQELERLEESDVKSFLQKQLRHKVAYHNASLSTEERLLIERLFREGQIQVLVSTTTLALGVNLPADVVIMGDYHRWDHELRTHVKIPVSEYKNSAGRAGRYGLGEEGYSFLLASDPLQVKGLQQEYIHGTLEKMDSAIPMERDIARHVLNMVVSGLATSKKQVHDMFKGSYAAQIFYKPRDILESLEVDIENVVARCTQAELLEYDSQDDALKPTALGGVAAQQGVSTGSISKIVAMLNRPAPESYSGLEILFELCFCDEVTGLPPYLRPDERGTPKWQTAISSIEQDFGQSLLAEVISRRRPPSDDENQALKKCLLLLEWSSGVRLGGLMDTFRVGHGYIQGLGGTVGWLTSTTAEAAKVLGYNDNFVNRLRTLASEVSFGVPKEVVPVRQLRVPGLTRDKVIRLVRNDKGVAFDSFDKIVDAEVDDFRGILDLNLVHPLQETILKNRKESLQRKQKGHLMRVERLALPLVLIRELYESQGTDFNIAIERLLNCDQISFRCVRVSPQRRGEADIHLPHPDGTIVIEATSSVDNVKPISWDKAREVLGSVGVSNPINFVTVGKPDFHELAISNAKELAAEGSRRLVLVPVAVLAEACIRVFEGKLDRSVLLNILRNQTGYLSLDEIP